MKGDPADVKTFHGPCRTCVRVQQTLPGRLWGAVLSTTTVLKNNESAANRSCTCSFSSSRRGIRLCWRDLELSVTVVDAKRWAPGLSSLERRGHEANRKGDL